MRSSPHTPGGLVLPVASPCPQRRVAGFSLVEVSLAIGVVAVAFVALLGLLPAGLVTFRQAMDLSVGAQIAQRIAAEVQETDFDVLLASAPTKQGGAGKQFFVLPVRHFDDQGSATSDPRTAGAAERQRTLYTVIVRGSLPGHASAARHEGDYFTSLPDAKGNRFNPRDLTILTIQVATNPGHRDLTAMVDRQTLLLDAARARSAGIAVQTYSMALARNDRLPPES